MPHNESVILKYHGYSEEERAIAHGFIEDSYDVLLSLARTNRRRAGFRDTMMTEDILHESFIKLSGRTVWQSQEQFIRTASLAIRQVVVDHARKNLALKRGGTNKDISYDEQTEFLPEFNETPEQIVILDNLLKKLEEKQPRLLVIVDARYFAAMSEAETALALGISERTVRRDWQIARAWLAEKMG